MDPATALQELVTSTGPLGALIWWMVTRVRGYLSGEFEKLHDEIAAVKRDIEELRTRDALHDRRIASLEAASRTPTIPPGQLQPV